MANYEDIFYNDGKLMCVLCSVFLSDDTFYIEAHINENDHKRRYFTRLLMRNGLELSGNCVKCSICKNDEIQLFSSIDHIMQQNHSQLLESIKNIVDKDGGFIELPESESENKLNCLLCHCEVTFTLEDIEIHVSGLKHKRARSIAIQPFNGIISVEGSDSDLWCKICKVYIPNFVETIFEHVDNNKDHVTSITKLLRLIDGQNITIEKFLVNSKEDKALCKTCEREVSCNIDNLERHIRGTLHQSKA